MLEIKNLHAKVEDKEILKGINLIINPGEVHAIMGPNGTGKSTLGSTIMGDPSFEVTKGQILVDGEDITQKEADFRSKKGIFLAMQHPIEIKGITNRDFIRTIRANHNGGEIESLVKQRRALQAATKDLNMSDQMMERSLNDGFSGGEKKKNEIIQLKMIEPKYIFLDEIDSGLDVDALNIVSENIRQYIKDYPESSLIIVTHYQRLLDLIKPTHVHVMKEGKIEKTGGFELVEEIDKLGYNEEKKKKAPVNSCPTKAGFNSAY